MTTSFTISCTLLLCDEERIFMISEKKTRQTGAGVPVEGKVGCSKYVGTVPSTKSNIHP
jgi:hypothetical protein